MKKIISITLSLILVLLLTACTKADATWQEQYNLGIRYLSELEYESAIQAFTSAINIDPRQAQIYIALADVYIAQENIEKAKEILNQGKESVNDIAPIDEKIKNLKPEPELTVKSHVNEDRTSVISKFNSDGLIVDWTFFNADNTVDQHWVYAYDDIAMTVMYYDGNDTLTGYTVSEYGEPGRKVRSGIIARSYDYNANGVLTRSEEYVNGDAGGFRTEYNQDGSIKQTYPINFVVPD